MKDIAQAAARGAVGAMAMTGMRTLTENLGIVGDTPPEAIFRQRVRWVMAAMPKAKRKGLKAMVSPGRGRAAMETAHIGFGAAAGAAFGALPPGVRRSPFAGPAYGVVVWLGYELGMAPALGLKHSGARKPLEHVALAADHVLYGLVLSESRRPPQE